MGLIKARTQYGIHSATFINRTTKVPYGTVKVLSSYAPAFTRESAELYGGSNPNAVDSEDGIIDNSLTLTLRELKPWIFEIAGYTVAGYTNGTGYVAEAEGKLDNYVDQIGSSFSNIVTGVVPSLTASDEEDLKDGMYFMKYKSATTFDLFCSTDVNFDNGTDVEFDNDWLLIAADIDCSSTPVVDADLGITFTSGSGILALVEGDVATFEVRSVNLGYSDYTLDSNPTPKEFGLYLASQKKSNGEFSLDYYPRAKFNAVPAGMTTQEWLEAELAVKVLFDTALQFSVRRRDIVKSLS